MHYSTITSFALVAFAAVASAAPVNNNNNSTINRVGCQTNADCANRGTGYTCQHNICVAPAPPSSVPALGCSTNADCQGRYNYPTVCEHAICVPAPPVSSTPIPVSSTPVPKSSAPVSSAPVSSAPPALGCMTNKDCQDRYPGKNAYCGPHNICMFAQPSSSAPISSAAPPPPVGCMTNKDCEGRYPFAAVCVHNMCVRQESTTTTTTTQPPPPPKVGCNKNADCAGRYPWEAVCVHNICIPKQPYIPTSTITITPSPPVTTTIGVTTITVYPPPPPYTPTTVTVYACTTTPTPITPTTPCAEATLFPNLIVPIKQASPNACYGTQYTGLVTGSANNDVDSLLAFDIPFIYETQNPTCQLSFTLPAIGTGFPRTVSGTGQVDLYALQSSNGIESATWNTRPSRGAYLGRVQIVDGQVAGWIESDGKVPCSGGTRVGVEMVPVGESDLEWFEMKTPLTGLTLEIFA